MIIKNNIQAITGIYAKTALNNARGTAKTEAPVQAEDELLISPQARIFGAQLQALHNGADFVREDKVKYYEELIASGNYHVDAEALAAKILDTRF